MSTKSVCYNCRKFIVQLGGFQIFDVKSGKVVQAFTDLKFGGMEDHVTISGGKFFYQEFNSLSFFNIYFPKFHRREIRRVQNCQ